jgi:hypothetical protein
LLAEIRRQPFDETAARTSALSPSAICSRQASTSRSSPYGCSVPLGSARPSSSQHGCG